MSDLWNKWDDVHASADQKKRIASAKKAECTPVSINKAEGTAVFSGSHGVYNTTLEQCQCGDFIRRRLPCKHMYRLAIECGLLAAESVATDSKAIKAPEPTPAERKQALVQAISILESYDEEVQNQIREIIYCYNTNRLYSCEDIKPFEQAIKDGLVEPIQNHEQAICSHTQKHTLEKLESVGFQFPEDLKSTKKARYEWCLANPEIVGKLVYSDFYFLQPAGLLNTAKKKVYTYLLRKFTDDLFVNEEGNMLNIPHGSQFVKTESSSGAPEYCLQFPEDEVTELLNQYGANRCTGFKI